jgi:hypothetical protein
MQDRKFRFSLRTLFIVTTLLAVTIAFVATHFRIVVGGLIALLWVLRFASGPIGSFVDAWPELRGPKLTKYVPQAGIRAERTADTKPD